MPTQIQITQSAYDEQIIGMTAQQIKAFAETVEVVANGPLPIVSSADGAKTDGIVPQGVKAEQTVTERLTDVHLISDVLATSKADVAGTSAQIRLGSFYRELIGRGKKNTGSVSDDTFTATIKALVEYQQAQWTLANPATEPPTPNPFVMPATTNGDGSKITRTQQLSFAVYQEYPELLIKQKNGASLAVKRIDRAMSDYAAHVEHLALKAAIENAKIPAVEPVGMDKVLVDFEANKTKPAPKVSKIPDLSLKTLANVWLAINADTSLTLEERGTAGKAITSVLNTLDPDSVNGSFSETLRKMREARSAK